jgi:hypothetical protein
MTWKPKNSYCSVNTCLCPVCGNDITEAKLRNADIAWDKYEVTCGNCGTKLEVTEEVKVYFHVQKCEIGI